MSITYKWVVYAIYIISCRVLLLLYGIICSTPIEHSMTVEGVLVFNWKLILYPFLLRGVI